MLSWFSTGENQGRRSTAVGSFAGCGAVPSFASSASISGCSADDRPFWLDLDHGLLDRLLDDGFAPLRHRCHGCRRSFRERVWTRRSPQS
jgi:hypothetical protein